MVDGQGRWSRAQPHARDQSTDWFKIIILSFFVSILTQIVLPQLHVVHTALKNGWDNHFKIDFKLADRVYIEEPFPVEKWKFSTNREITKKKVESDVTCDAEALAAVSAAKNARKEGNLKKCKTIMEHALALSPQHPDVLTEYGLFLETVNEDFVKADGFYHLALAHDPHHSVALISVERTRDVVAEIDKEELIKLRRKKDEFGDMTHSTSLRRAMRESYFSHIYHTVAIEGNTLTLGQTRSILETGMPISGKSLIEHNEVLGMDSALRFLNHSLIDNNGFSLEDILEMHRHVLGFVSPGDAGRIRTTQVYVGRFTPAPPDAVLAQMEELIDWLNDGRTNMMEPVELAAIAHYKLVLTHPFVDGNGRTARLLMNLVLMRNGFPPVILPVEDKAEYYATLQTANLGDLRPFVRFVAKHTGRTLDKYLQLSQAPCTSIDCSTEKANSDATRIPPA